MNTKSLILLGLAASSTLFIYKKFKEKMPDEDVTFSRLALALANDYVSVYYINTEDDSYVEYSATGSDKKLTVLSKGDNFFEDTRRNCKLLVYKEDQDRFLATLKKETLLEAVKNGNTFTLSYRLMIDDQPKHYRLKTTRGTGSDDKYIIIGVRNVDTQVRREQAAAAESVTYEQISKALASRYEVIYYIDIVTDEYVEYSSSEKYSKLKVGTRGKDFFGDTQRNMKRDIYPEDYPMMAAEMEKERFINELSQTGSNSLTYRLNLDGRPQYVNLRAVKPKDDPRHVIIGVANIDTAKRREMEFREALGSAMDMANRDALTGVKSKHAYKRAEEELDLQITENNNPDFAIVVFDVNNLKYINDTLGHHAGDEFIKSACQIICTTFKHSPVYRIGGDEFAALLKGEDYENRAALMELLESTVLDNKQNGLVTIASGISVFDREIDQNMESVFERADDAMYSNKKMFKKKNLPA